MPVTRKSEVELVDGTPVKRMFWSIISDYDLKTGLCELVDNAIDLWTFRARAQPLTIKIDLIHEQQIISVRDNAGGVSKKDLNLLISPGGSRNDPSAELIGIFGVGGKRASIALGEHVEIKTRFKKDQTYQIDITKDWLATDDWDMPAYAIPDIAPGNTSVEISQLRKPFLPQAISEIRDHLSETYGWFLENGCKIEVNDIPIEAAKFDNWSYPRGFSPRAAQFQISIGAEKVIVDITGGLISDRDPEIENYGVYFYCNNRLIVKELRTRDVGYFVSSEAGVPHPDASMCRVIVQAVGPAKLMFWNSSKSGINTGHVVFQKLRPTLITLVSYYSSLSRRLKNDWDLKVIPFSSGKIEMLSMPEIVGGKRLSLPELPRVNKRQIDHLRANNKKILKDAPWTVGLVEAIAAVDIISKQKLDTRNRIALILLDSNFEIGLKEFVVHRADLFPPSQYPDSKILQLFKHRPDVIKEVTQKISLPSKLLAKVAHYYNLRNKLIHERATVDVSNTDVENYRSTIQSILGLLFKLKFNG